MNLDLKYNNSNDKQKHIFDIDYKYKSIDEQKYSDIITEKIIKYNSLIEKYFQYKHDYNEEYRITCKKN